MTHLSPWEGFTLWMIATLSVAGFVLRCVCIATTFTGPADGRHVHPDT
jgi:hypothetical protein